MAQESRSAREPPGARHREVLNLHLQRRAGTAAPVEEVTHRNVEHEGDHSAMQAALRVVHEVFHLEADPAFVVGIFDVHPVKLHQEKLAEVLCVGGYRLLEGRARHRFIHCRHLLRSKIAKPQA